MIIKSVWDTICSWVLWGCSVILKILGYVFAILLTLLVLILSSTAIMILALYLLGFLAPPDEGE